MRARVLEAVRGVGVGFVAAGHRALVGALARVGARVDLKVLGPAEALVALGASVGLLVGMRPDVHQHLVAGVEAALATLAAVPAAEEEPSAAGRRMHDVDVVRQLLQVLERLPAAQPAAVHRVAAVRGRRGAAQGQVGDSTAEIQAGQACSAVAL